MLPEKKPDWTLRLEARQIDEPASGVHMLAQMILEFAKTRAKECGYELTIEQSVDE